MKNALFHGVGVAAVAMAVPDDWMSIGGKLGFAVAVTLITTSVSKLVSMLFARFMKDRKDD